MTGEPVSFGDWRVDPAARELRMGDRLVDLPPHVFDCICYLIEHRDRAVGRDELVAAVWGRTEVSDTLIGQTVMRIRREFGDDGKDQRILRTIPRFGYRWVAEVDSGRVVPDVAAPATTPAAGGEAVADTRPPNAEVTPRKSRDLRPLPMGLRRLAVWLLPPALLALALILLPTSPAPEPGTKEPASGQLSAAVLPADLDQGTTTEWSWLRFGVMDVVSSRLRSSGVPALPSESVIALAGSAAGQDPAKLRDAASVALLVRSSVSASGGGWQVRLDADDGEGLRVSVDAQAADALQAARDAADKLLVVLGREAPAGQVEAEPLEQLIHRIDAAVLADDPETAKSIIRQAPAAQRDSPEVGLRLAKLDFRTGRSDAALQRLQDLLAQAPAQTQPELRAGILNGLGALAIRADRPAEAETYFGEAAALLESGDNLAQLGEAYLGQAAAAAEQDQYDAATAGYARARVALRQANDTLALLRVDANQGLLELERGLPAQALPQLVAASRGFEQWGALNEAIFSRLGEIDARLDLLQVREALEAVASAERLAQRVSSRTTLISLALTRSRALAAAGQWTEARQVLADLRQTSPPPSENTSLIIEVQLAAILLEEGKPREALSQIGLVPDKLSPINQATERADASWIRLSALIQLGERAAAATELDAFASWAGQVDNRHARLLAQLGRAEFDWRFGSGDAHEEFSKAVQWAEASGVPADIAIAAGRYAEVLLAEGELELARAEVGRLSRWSDSDFRSAVLEARLYAALGRDEARQAALVRARSLAGERLLPEDATSKPISTREASSQGSGAGTRR